MPRDTCPLCVNSSSISSYRYNNPPRLIKKLLYYIAKGIMSFPSTLGVMKFIPGLQDTKTFKKLKTSAAFSGNIIRCNNCGFGFLDKTLRYEELEDYYSFEYWGEERRIEDLPAAPEYSARVAGQYDFVKDYVQFPCQVLEIGPGEAEFLIFLSLEHGTKDIDVIEPGDIWEDFYKKLGFRLMGKYFSNPTEAKYDYIHTSHWLEHQQYPIETMENLFLSLNKGGALFVEVPNCNDDYYKIVRHHTPHVCFYNSKSLRLIAEKVGFTVLNISTFGFSWSDDSKWRRGEISRDEFDYQNRSNSEGINLRMLCVK